MICSTSSDFILGQFESPGFRHCLVKGQWLHDWMETSPWFFLKDGDRLGWGGLSGNCIISGHRNFTAWAPVVMQLESPNICPAACAKAEIPLLHICKAYLHLWCSFVLQIVSMKMLMKANRTVPAAFWKRPIFGKFDQCETLTEKIWQSTRDKDEMWNFIFHLLPI